MRISNESYNNFAGVYKITTKLADGGKKISWISPKIGASSIGEDIFSANGAVRGWRKFKSGERIDYTTVNTVGLSGKKVGTERSVSYTYNFPDGKGKFLRKWFVFDLDKFKENMRELMSLKGIKRYIAKIENSPKTTKLEPCS